MARFDDFLDRITMYRLTLWLLAGLLGVAATLSIFGALPFVLSDLLISIAALVIVCVGVNALCSRLFSVPANPESAYITALILALLLSPAPITRAGALANMGWYFLVGSTAMASKYLIAFRRSHIFNPAAFGVAIGGIASGRWASWWVGTPVLLLFVAAAGFLIVRKTRRADMVFSFLVAAFAAVAYGAFVSNGLPMQAVQALALRTALVFFATVMLTEPATAPAALPLRIAYGIAAGILFSPYFSIFGVSGLPEFALLASNAIFYFAAGKQRYRMTLVRAEQYAPDIFEFSFTADRLPAFAPGQYLEWTIGHEHSDARGVRRYFTIASAPEERDIKLCARFPEHGSSFKQELRALAPGGILFAGQRAGDFVLPKDTAKKLAFCAGGIGITPFRSMVKHMLMAGEQRDAVLLYSNTRAADIVYQDVWDEAARKFGMKTVHTLTDTKAIPNDWRGRRGFIDANLITEEISDWRERIFYISGPHSFVISMERALEAMGVARAHIKTDFFPGYA